MNSLVFVYGTLLEKENSIGAFLQKNSSREGNGHFTGFLFDAGAYPGAVYRYSPDTNHPKVWGTVYRLNDPVSTLEVLDDYEGCHEPASPSDEYIRREIPVAMNGSLVRCWTYLYVLPTYALTPVPSGNYAEYIKEKRGVVKG